MNYQSVSNAQPSDKVMFVVLFLLLSLIPKISEGYTALSNGVYSSSDTDSQTDYYSLVMPNDGNIIFSLENTTVDIFDESLNTVSWNGSFLSAGSYVVKFNYPYSFSNIDVFSTEFELQVPLETLSNGVYSSSDTDSQTDYYSLVMPNDGNIIFSLENTTVDIFDESLNTVSWNGSFLSAGSYVVKFNYPYSFSNVDVFSTEFELQVPLETLSNGVCGSNNGATLTTQPTTNLCTSGTSSALVGANPWLWSCSGVNGGSTATCATVKSFVDSTPEESVVTEGDSDGDGLSNQQEVDLGTNPNHADSDGDGMPDAWEVEYGLNPTLNDAAVDTDKDGLSNLEEYYNNQNPNEANLDPAAKIFKQHGHGSVIAHYGQTELSNSNRYGISKDDIKLHADGTVPVAMVQWQIDASSCSKLKLSMEDSRLANVQITYGAWDNRQDDMIFTDVHLPFVIGAENTQDTEFADGSWRVLSVGFDQALNLEATLKVECSSDPVTNATAVQATQLIVLENNQQWQGTGSIISAEYSSTGTANSYGILRDEVVLKPVGEGKVNGNPSVFFQWQGSEYCRAIELNTMVDGISQASTAILGVKNWNAETYQTEQITFPYRLEQPVTDDGRLQDWSLLQLDFQAVEQDTKVTAYCLQNSSHYTWSGNGSIISHTGITYLGNTVDQYGVNKDSVSIHANTSYPPVGFFQWQINTNQCSSLTFDVDNETVRNNATINITYGAWSQREDDKVFKQVRLPFTVNASNMGETHNDGNWRVFAVAFNEIQSVSTNLNAHCSNNVSSSASPVAGEAIVLENGSIWSGTGSIIRSEFGNSIGSETPYGVTRDVSKTHAGKNNSVLLQWQPSDQCTQLQIVADSTSTKQDFAVSWGMKAWNAEEYETMSSQLPLTIDRGDNSWNLIRLDFSGDVTEAAQIKADCL